MKEEILYCQVDYRRYKRGYFASGRTKVYTTWGSMKQRCLNPKDSQYHDYGGRGITCCERWNDFDNFFEDMGHPPSKELTLERINTDGNYEPSNCIWDTRKNQMRNRRCNRLITIGGRTQCLSAWAEESGVQLGTIRSRLKAGCPEEELLIKPKYLTNKLHCIHKRLNKNTCDYRVSIWKNGKCIQKRFKKLDEAITYRDEQLELKRQASHPSGS